MSQEHSAARNFIDRRSFLRAVAGGVVGAGLGLEALPPYARAVNEGVTKITDHQTGNASIRQMIQDSCADQLDPEECVENYEPTFKDKVNAGVIAPIIEEVLFRFIPSMILDSRVYDQDNCPDEVVAGGTEPFEFSGKELLYGLVSSLIFGAAHNITSKGINTKTIPASQTADGLVYWFLMRRFGIASSVAAHAAFNYRSIHSKK